MGTRNTRNNSAIADSVESVDTLAALAIMATADESAPADDESTDTADESAPTLSYSVDGVIVTVDPDRVDTLATALGSGRTARHGRALTVGQFIADYNGMTPNRAATILKSAGHYVHRDTVNGAANAYALSVEFVGADAVIDPASILADVLSLVDAVGIRRIKGTHNNVSVIDYDTLSTMTDETARAAEFESAVRSALTAARTVSTPVKVTDDESGDDESTESTDDESGDESGPVDIPAMWVNALTDIARAILTDGGALTDAQRRALVAGADDILSALASTAAPAESAPVDTADDTAPAASTPTPRPRAARGKSAPVAA